MHTLHIFIELTIQICKTLIIDYFCKFYLSCCHCMFLCFFVSYSNCSYCLPIIDVYCTYLPQHPSFINTADSLILFCIYECIRELIPLLYHFLPLQFSFYICIYHIYVYIYRSKYCGSFSLLFDKSNVFPRFIRCIAMHTKTVE